MLPPDRYEEDVMSNRRPGQFGTLAISRGRAGTTTLMAACAAVVLLAVVLIAAALALEGPRLLWAQETPACETIDLGALGGEAESELEAAGRWTTEDCDSRFRPGSDAHTYRFEVTAGGRTRVDLTSGEGDSYLYLLTQDGTRITDNDDGGADLDARIERDLTPGVYLVEVTTVGGRSRGPADFSLSISRVTGCEPTHLGTLRPEVDLMASGSWTLDTCGSGFVVEHPAHRYLFNLPEDGRVLIDLMSTNGDPVLSLVSLSAGLIGANDDGGERRNSRLERYLPAGAYLIEATTYRERDYQPLRADFVLVVRFVDEETKQRRFQLKIEETHTPEQVVAGEPFPVHYRVGNLGGGDLATSGKRASVRGWAARVGVHFPHRRVIRPLAGRSLLPHRSASRKRDQHRDQPGDTVRSHLQHPRSDVGVCRRRHLQHVQRGNRVPRPLEKPHGGKRQDVQSGHGDSRRPGLRRGGGS